MDDILCSITRLEEKLVDAATKAKTPIGGSLELTPLCNMNCDMCYVRLSRDEMERQGRLHTADEWLALADEMRDAGVLFLLLTGGEPLLYPDFRRLYLGLREKGMILAINTNGTLIDEQWADFFAENPPRRINITLYGSGKRAYNELCHYGDGFERAVSAIRLLRQRDVAVKVSGSIVAANSDEAEQITDIAKALDAAVNIDTYMYPASRERTKGFDEHSRLSPEEAAEARVKLMRIKHGEEKFCNVAASMLHAAGNGIIDRDYSRVTCRAGRSSFTINWQGKMRPCVMMSDFGVPVFETGFEKAWSNIVESVDGIRLSSKCAACRLRSVCQTCAACALLESGSFDGVPDYMCRYTAATLNGLYRELKAAQDKQMSEKG